MSYVPVVSRDQKPLMPTTSARARRWVESGKATPFWKRGIWCVRLNSEASGGAAQPIAVGIDPGSMKEGITVKSAAHTYLNVQADAVTWVKEAMEARRCMRKKRRGRKTPYRRDNKNRTRGGLPPSTRARWQWKLRLVAWLRRMFPISAFVVEDIKSRTRKARRHWNINFSPLQIGKAWFYGELDAIAPVNTISGWQTKELRDLLGLEKSKSKKSNGFSAHCVDSWVLANWFTGGHAEPDAVDVLLVTPLRFHRRKLHAFQPTKGGRRRLYGGTRSLGFKRGSIVRHRTRGVCYVGGTSGDRISLHAVTTGERLGRSFKTEDCRFLAYNSWRQVRAPQAEAADSCA